MDSGQNTSLKGKLKRAFTAVVTHPSFLLSTGNIALAAVTGNVPGLIMQIGTTALIAGLAARAGWQNKPLHLPFYVLGAANLLTAGFGFAGGAPTRVNLMSNTALTGWGIGHVISGYRTATAKKHKHIIGDNMVWYGAADMSAIFANPATSFNPISFPFSAAGLLKTLFNQKTAPKKEGSLGWHITAARLYGLGYFTSGLVALATNPAFALVSTLWALGSWSFDKPQNKALRASLRHRLQHLKA